MLANGDTLEGLLEENSSIKREDIFACLDYAGSLTEEQLSLLEILESKTSEFW